MEMSMESQVCGGGCGGFGWMGRRGVERSSPSPKKHTVREDWD